jgi:hypothetical protein
MTLVAREHDWVTDDPPSIMAYLRKIQAADKSDAGEP